MRPCVDELGSDRRVFRSEWLAEREAETAQYAGDACERARVLSPEEVAAIRAALEAQRQSDALVVAEREARAARMGPWRRDPRQGATVSVEDGMSDETTLVPNLRAHLKRQGRAEAFRECETRLRETIRQRASATPLLSAQAALICYELITLANWCATRAARAEEQP